MAVASAPTVRLLGFRGLRDAVRPDDVLLAFATEVDGRLRETTVLIDGAGRLGFPHLLLDTGESLGSPELDARVLGAAETIVAILDAAAKWRTRRSTDRPTAWR